MESEWYETCTTYYGDSCRKRRMPRLLGLKKAVAVVHGPLHSDLTHSMVLRCGHEPRMASNAVAVFDMVDERLSGGKLC